MLTKISPPTLKNILLLAKERAVRIHIGVAARDIAEPRNLVTIQVTPANEADQRVEAFTVEIDPRDQTISQRAWMRLFDAVDTMAPRGRVIMLNQ